MGAPIKGTPTWFALSIGDGRGGAVELGNADRKRLVVGLGPILKYTESDLFAQKNRPVGRAAEVDAGVYTMSCRNVPRQLIQLAVDIDSICIATAAGVQR